ncbi:hypothetical protein HPP92_025985 [Vanilla planifolia]|uniref:Uncharacterized protein n=2 Tax=Vanilla planifolia TaxID=51239 RepID=A0A835PGD0_VANPL|nr:hypothetical protein HPP92_025985 [Vanilla planifolia]
MLQLRRIGKLKSEKKSFVLLLLLLNMQILDSALGRTMVREAKGKSLEGQSSSSTTSYVSQTLSFNGSKDDDIDPLYGVSKRIVPQGPNPLHN